MILLTIGTQLPFDRLVRTVDELLPQLGREGFGQIGRAGYRPRHMAWAEMLGPAEFEARMKAASVVVAHAGIGTILAARRHRKPLVIMPRLASLGEHRNDHQLATARELGTQRGVYVVSSSDELAALLARHDLAPACEEIEPPARRMLVDNLRSFLNDEQPSGT